MGIAKKKKKASNSGERFMIADSADKIAEYRLKICYAMTKARCWLYYGFFSFSHTSAVSRCLFDACLQFKGK
ncbi:MAG: hypothetical protein OXE98_09450 [Hyphomicrobiales bacterium]|nr:hypothetical protein [Hyphomicrobiales bacterium]